MELRKRKNISDFLDNIHLPEYQKEFLELEYTQVELDELIKDTQRVAELAGKGNSKDKKTSYGIFIQALQNKILKTSSSF